MPRTSICSVWFLVLLATAASPSSATAQAIRGMVVDSLTAEPLREAWVTLSGREDTLSVITGADGRFELTLEGESPFDLTVRRIGYQERTLVVGLEAVPEELRIGLAVAPLDLEGLAVEAEREGPDFRFGNWVLADSGLVSRRNPSFGCYFVMIDRVIVKDYDLLRPEVLENYEQPRKWMGGFQGQASHKIR